MSSRVSVRWPRDNKLLGNFRLDGIAPASRGQPKIEVTFDIDANGILNVTARDQATGKEQKITITASTNMSKDDIERAIREAESHASDDRSRKEEADVRNEGDSICYAVERQIKELGESLCRGEIESRDACFGLETKTQRRSRPRYAQVDHERTAWCPRTAATGCQTGSW